jgi:phosphoribosylformimino-5-aminoimidazole carboxamide ribotide isomerase
VSFTVYPAIDVAGGRAVRLRRGERSHLRVVDFDPVGLARRFAQAGARFLHVVDLDAAFGGAGNDAVIRRIIAEVACPVQVGGGVRSAARFDRLRQAGAARVVVGTAAIGQPELLAGWLAADAGAVVVAADSRGGRVVVSGWTKDGGASLSEFARGMRDAGARHLLVTAVERDGTGEGADVGVLEQALAAFGPGVIASGGIGEVGHLAALARLTRHGLAGVVVGSLLVDGRASVGELNAVAADMAASP